MKDFISLHDCTKEEIEQLLSLAIKLKKETKEGKEHHILKGKTLGMIFTKSSTRTRVSFEVGMTQLGGYPLFLSSNTSTLTLPTGVPSENATRTIFVSISLLTSS